LSWRSSIFIATSVGASNASMISAVSSAAPEAGSVGIENVGMARRSWGIAIVDMAHPHAS